MLSNSMIYTVINNKSCKESSKVKYKKDLEQIKKYFKTVDFSCLLFPKKIIKYLESKYKNKSTLKGKLISIYTTLKDLEIEKGKKEEYKNIMLKYRNKNNKDIKDNKATEKQKKNKITFVFIKEKTEELNKELLKVLQGTPLSLFNIESINNKRSRKRFLRTLSDYITLFYLCNTPPTRLEIYNIYFSKTKGASDNYIYLDNTKNTATYFINDFKNINRIGKQKITYSVELTKVLIDYYKFLILNNFKRENKYYLFSNFKAGKISPFKKPNSFSNYINRLFFKYFKKQITINDLRHIYTTDFMNNPTYTFLSINEKEKKHMALLHNKETGEEYYKKYEDSVLTDISYKNREELKKLLLLFNYNLI